MLQYFFSVVTFPVAWLNCVFTSSFVAEESWKHIRFPLPLRYNLLTNLIISFWMWDVCLEWFLFRRKGKNLERDRLKHSAKTLNQTLSIVKLWWPLRPIFWWLRIGWYSIWVLHCNPLQLHSCTREKRQRVLNLFLSKATHKLSSFHLVSETFQCQIAYSWSSRSYLSRKIKLEREPKPPRLLDPGQLLVFSSLVRRV